MKSCLKQLLLVVLTIAVFGLISQAQAQTQTTSYYNSYDNSAPPGAPAYVERVVDYFEDTYDQTTGLHSGRIFYSREYDTRSTINTCPYNAGAESLYNFVVYDINGNVIVNFSTASAGAGEYVWSGKAGASVGRIDVFTVDNGVAYGDFGENATSCDNGGPYSNQNALPNRPFSQTPLCPTVAGSSFSASPNGIVQGQSSTLTWNVPNATSITIVGVGTFGPSGSVVVSPSSTTTYTLTASGAGSCPQIQLQATVNVTSCPTVAGSTFAASPPSIVAGQNSILSWNVPNATSVTISGVGTFAPSGSVAVSPSSTTTYTLTASGASGCTPITLQTTVTVCPSVAASSFAASPTTIVLGGTSTLTWNVPNATAVSISGIGSVGASGSIAVSPSSTTTYTLTASGAGGCSQITMQATVNVTPCPTVAGSSFNSSPSSIVLGGSSTLTWNVPNATSVTISGVAGTFGASGSVAVSPSSTTTYTLTATGAGACASIQMQTTVAVTSCPTVAGSSFSSSPNTIVLGGTSTLTWNVPNATSVTISGIAGTFGSSGSVAVSPSTTTTYTLTATGAGACASIQLQATVNVTPCPTAAGSTFTSSPGTINFGGTSTLTWNVPNATSVTISGIAGTFGASGSVAVSPSSTTTYTLTAAGAGACASVQLQATVNVTQPPSISSFAPATSPICAGGSTSLTWSSTGGTSATISAPGLPGSPVSVTPNSGSLSVSPSSTTTYTLTVTNGAGTVTRTATVNVTAPASVSTFSANTTSIYQGQSVTFTYSVSGPHNSITLLDRLTGVETAVASPSGTVTVSPSSTRGYQLLVNTNCGIVSSSIINITVTPCPTVAGSSFSASPSAIIVGQSASLSWNVPNATSVTISGIAGTFSSSGSVSVSPSSSTTYTLTATGGGTCASIQMQTTVAVSSAGLVWIGPQGQPTATGPTNANDDYTNMTLTSGVAVPFGGVTTNGGVLTFTNTVLNDSTIAQPLTLQAVSIPAGFTVEASINGGANWVNMASSSVSGTLQSNQSFDVLIRVTAPSGISVLTGYPVVLRVFQNNNPAIFNETIDRVWTGFIRADKSTIITNSTGVGGPTAAVRGAVIEYVVTYTNITAAPAGTGNVNLTATNIVLTENGNAAPNNWGTTTTHVAGSASDSRGGTITGDVAGSSLLTDTVPSLAPTQSGIFRFKRTIK